MDIRQSLIAIMTFLEIWFLLMSTHMNNDIAVTLKEISICLLWNRAHLQFLQNTKKQIIVGIKNTSRLHRHPNMHILKEINCGLTLMVQICNPGFLWTLLNTSVVSAILPDCEKKFQRANKLYKNRNAINWNFMQENTMKWFLYNVKQHWDVLLFV